MSMASHGLAAFALTDHDTIAGLEEASASALANEIEFVAGIEISVIEDNRETHILGYYPRNLAALKDQLDYLQNQRFTRMEKIIHLLNKHGFKISYEEVLDEAGDAVPGRLHLARLMLRKKYIHTIEEGFKLYLGAKSFAYVPRQTLGLAETIALLVECKAVPVIAHPGAEGLRLINQLVPLGLKGIEVFHPDHSRSLRKDSQKIAAEYSLVVTGGSDFHGYRDNEGFYPLKQTIAYHYLSELKLIALQT